MEAVQTSITAPIIGATKMTHLDDAIAAVDVTLTNDEINRLEAPYVPHEIAGHNCAAQVHCPLRVPNDSTTLRERGAAQQHWSMRWMG
jgi:hypothetical protein